MSPADIAEALRAVLREPRYRKAALAMRAEIAQLPGPEHVVELLEGLVVGAGSGP
ncbi:MAG TPA: hypothetical protein VML96_09955 [Egibacteraceae bacterium]|nr:hypothetical protein [Egibacteraceae bacterium]